jgi:hypothetical protein
MANPEVISFIKDAVAKNIPETQIRENLQKNGWDNNEIQDAFLNLTTPTSQNTELNAPIKHVTTGAHGMWDAFEHILLFISLYFLASSVALTLHLYVDKWLPGVLNDATDYYSTASYLMSSNDTLQTITLRGYLASLLVSCPLFIFFFLNITKRTLKDPTMRNIRSRKILIYITLIIAFLIMLGHVTYLVYALLSGNVDLNLLLHFFVTIFVNGIIFVYYLLQVKQDRRIHA